ncbi:uncharacterized protein LOC114351061 [Ostrinia furnacalis]|uniref:uncharacterized protein LOC114351061 n=1 Tax=Ostrinia furnacalis TaxID=93504 RepID=UPI001039EAB2|nr:uncharacterized protein LOC114351061 [Ostrinia furnacalis]
MIDPSLIYSDKSHSCDLEELKQHVLSRSEKPVPSKKVMEPYLNRKPTNWPAFLEDIDRRGLSAEKLLIGLKGKERELKIKDVSREKQIDLNETEFKNRFRLSKEAFIFLCDKLRRKISLKSTKRISLENHVLCALSFYATGSYQRLVGMAKHLGQTTVSKYAQEVTDALVSPPILYTLQIYGTILFLDFFL